ncbi:MAG TPA: GntR family transcriptional regulator [Candidatus Acidoferrum sp.]|nr:GntR family transcriptional regulator [Candidatus Acidoferrum sp.]
MRKSAAHAREVEGSTFEVRIPRNAFVDRSAPMPLYYQIAEHLRRQMRRQKMRPGDLLTTDERVQEDFGVSRATARKAIDELVDEGFVERVTGKGTFVAEPRLQVPLPAMLSFTEELERRGMRPSARIVSVAWVSAGERIAQVLAIGASARVLRLERIRSANGEPILHTVDLLPGFLGIGPEEDFSGSLYKLMESRGISLAECQNIIEASVTDRRLASLLHVRKGFPILALQRTSYDANGRPVLYEDASCRGDLYRYAVRLARQGQHPASRTRRSIRRAV